MNSGGPTFEYKPEYRKEMEEILLKRKSRKRFLFFWLWTFGALLLVAGGVFYFLQGDAAKGKTVSAVQEVSVKDLVQSTGFQKDVRSVDQPAIEKVAQQNPETAPQKEVAQLEQRSQKTPEKIVKKTNPVKVIEESATQYIIPQKEEEKVLPANSAETITSSSFVKQDSVLTINENPVVAADSSMALQNNSDTAAACTVAKVPDDSVKAASSRQWILYLGVGANNSIGEGEYTSGIAPSFKAGVHFEKEINGPHALGVGLQGRFYSGLYNWGGYDTLKLGMDNPNNSGYDKMEARVVTHNQNNFTIGLSLPLYYRYSAAKFNFSVGATVDYLLVNQYQQTSDTSKYGINTFVLYTEVLVDKTQGAKVKKQDFRGINQFNFGPFIEVDYQLSPKISLGLSGQVFLKDLSDDAVVQVSKNSSLYTLNASLKYSIFQKGKTN
ncbi:MAG: hypothetical protein ACKOXB_09410 [Flavobacteriales bacterium]